MIVLTKRWHSRKFHKRIISFFKWSSLELIFKKLSYSCLIILIGEAEVKMSIMPTIPLDQLCIEDKLTFLTAI